MTVSEKNIQSIGVPFNEGLCLVRLNGLWSFIDKSAGLAQLYIRGNPFKCFRVEKSRVILGPLTWKMVMVGAAVKYLNLSTLGLLFISL
jgi:hypothetical protein